MLKYFFAVVVLAVCLAGCRSAGQPLVIDASDFERVRFDLEQLRGEYAALQQAHRELTEFQRVTTEAIGRGLDELSGIGADSQSEIERLRELSAILRSLLQIVIETDAGIGTGER